MSSIQSTSTAAPFAQYQEITESVLESHLDTVSDSTSRYIEVYR
jgi:hypothetical protein